METVEQPIEQKTTEQTEAPKTYSYGKRPLWQWIMLYLIIGGIIYAGIYYFFLRNKGYIYSNNQYQQTTDQSNTNTDNIKKDNTNQNITSTEEWKTYTNSQYGFQVTYPAKGILVHWNKSSPGWTTSIGECGLQIALDTANPDRVRTQFYLDNFFGIGIADINGSLADYIKQIDPEKVNVYTPIVGSNADEAVSVQANTTGSQTPLGEVYSLYIKNNKLFTLYHFQNAGHDGACMPLSDPASYNAEFYPTITKEEYTQFYNFYRTWNIPQSFKFTK